MKTYVRAMASAVVLVATTYGLLLIAAAALPAPRIPNNETSQSSVVADQLKAEAALLAHPGTRPEDHPQRL